MTVDCMRSGCSPSARAMPGNAVLRIVVSSVCMKNASATTQGSQRRVAASNSGRAWIEFTVMAQA
jgi:hypothetical protein